MNGKLKAQLFKILEKYVKEEDDWSDAMENLRDDLNQSLAEIGGGEDTFILISDISEEVSHLFTKVCCEEK